MIELMLRKWITANKHEARQEAKWTSLHGWQGRTRTLPGCSRLAELMIRMTQRIILQEVIGALGSVG
ncbi:hypothetical protein C7Y70_16200 [Pseudoalteromonas sp. KS88]|nr:hypothetical protein C7Y70_16200 [Pseudoalteromonas sp. KS88]